VPENDQVVAWHATHCETIEALRRKLMASAEFRERNGFAGTPALARWAPGEGIGEDQLPAIALDATAEDVTRLLVLAQRYWQRIGDAAPHWSALPDLIYRPERIDSSRRSLFASGREDREILEGVLGRLGVAPSRLGRLVDFGCGVGRATLHLAALTPDVTGVDFAASQLAVAKAAARQRGLDHIAWRRVLPGVTMPEEGCDVWFSRRALQHNPPPVIRALLRRTFADLRPGGIAVFQLLTWGLGYGFSVAEGLATPIPRDAPQHVLPQQAVFALVAEAGLELLGVHDDPVPGLDRTRWLSHLFVVRRPN
jgi:SAM-dependent methyltransferase